MSSDTAQVTQAQKLKALRQIQFVLDRGGHPTARACGLTEPELEALANGGCIEVFFSRDDGPDLDRYHIAKLLPEGWSILSQAYAADDPVRIAVVPQNKSVLRRIYEGTRSGLWDLIKVAVGALLGWYLKKYFP